MSSNLIGGKMKKIKIIANNKDKQKKGLIKIENIQFIKKDFLKYSTRLCLFFAICGVDADAIHGLLNETVGTTDD